MAERRFGPTLGAGTVIRERSGNKQIQPGALGVCVMVGMTEKGDVGELISCPTKQKFSNRCGDLLDYSMLPQAARDFFDEGQGSGELYIVRVTDGEEVASAIYLKNRRDPKTDVVKVSAKNGGEWGGKRAFEFGEVTTIGTDITATTIETGLTLKENQFVGGTVKLLGVPDKSYPIISNDTDGTVDVAADADMIGDLLGGSDPTNKAFALQIENGEKYLAIRVMPNAVDPVNLFDVEVYQGVDMVINWDNLSMDPDNTRYFESVINDDGNNDWITVEDLWGGSITADIQPANYFAESLTLAATSCKINIEQHSITPVGATNPVAPVTIGTLGASVVPDVLTLTFTTTTQFDIVSAELGALYGSGEVPNPVSAPNDYGFDFTIGASTGDPYTAGDVITLVLSPLPVDELIGGEIIPDWANDNRTRYQITDNTGDTITVGIGQDMTNGGAITVPTDVLLIWNDQLSGGVDGNAGVGAPEYNAVMEPTTTVIRELLTKNKGLVKIAVPGVTLTSVQKAGANLAEALNYQFRVEVPANITDEDAAADYINDTIGRNDYMVGAFPSQSYIQNPLGVGKVLRTSSGQVFGEEAAIARNFDGYHKAAAGESAILSKILELPTGDTVLNEEKLNPLGLQIIKKLKGNFVIWGDRTLATSGGQMWKHKREQLSYYEHVLQENFNWIIFAINDPATRSEARTALRSFFIPEWRKRALQGNTVDEAVQIKIDSENNPPSATAAGNMFAEITLWLADTVERFIITISERGIFEDVS